MQKKTKTTIISLAVLILTIFGITNIGVNNTISTNKEIKDGTYRVAYVIDGDTIALWVGQEARTVRIIGIDTPEIDHGNGGGECQGEEAKSYAIKQLNEKLIRFESDPSQDTIDSYDRYLGHIFLNQTLYSEKIIKAGLAKEYTYIRKNNYTDILREAESEAKENNIGIWNKNICP